MRKPTVPGCHGPRMPLAQVLAESCWRGARRRDPSVCALGERRQPERGGWQHPGSCGGARGVSRERGRQMSRGPAQPGLWQREVRASGRSLLDSWRSHPLCPPSSSHPGKRGSTRQQRPGYSCQIPGAGTTFGTGRREEKKVGGGRVKRPETQSVEFGKRQKKVG